VWSLGVILFELLTLELPFHAGNMPALIMQIVNAVR
jgi:serine/threonine protein kinase